jgi:DNA-directed RNA polymerase subunit RPC12/RpoP
MVAVWSVVELQFFKSTKKGLKCTNCGSLKVTFVAEVPWSVEGLIPKPKTGYLCEHCGFFERIMER